MVVNLAIQRPIISWNWWYKELFYASFKFSCTVLYDIHRKPPCSHSNILEFKFYKVSSLVKKYKINLMLLQLNTCYFYSKNVLINCRCQHKENILTLLLRPSIDNITNKRSSLTSSLSSKSTTIIVCIDDRTLSEWSSLHKWQNLE